MLTICIVARTNSQRLSSSGTFSAASRTWRHFSLTASRLHFVPVFCVMLALSLTLTPSLTHAPSHTPHTHTHSHSFTHSLAPRIHRHQIPHVQDAATAERRINSLVRLKHNLELVPHLRKLLSHSSCSLFTAFASSLEDPGFDNTLKAICRVLNDDARVEKGSLNKRTQHIYSIREDIHGACACVPPTPLPTVSCCTPSNS